MNRTELYKLLKDFGCTDCEGLSVQKLKELRDGLVEWQTELENDMSDDALAQITKIEGFLTNVNERIDTETAAWQAKVNEAKNRTKVPADAIADEQPEAPVAEDGSTEIEGKVLVATGVDGDGKRVFDGQIRTSLQLAKTIAAAVGRYGAGAGVDGMIPVVAGRFGGDYQVIESGDSAEAATAKMLKAVQQFNERQAAMYNGLTADGGFCAPITPDLSFCDLSDSNLDLFQASLPSIRSTRGRVQYMQTPTNDQFFDQFGGIDDDSFVGVGTLFTETDSIAVDPDDDSTWKGFIEVDCPEQQDPAEISAHYTNVRFRHFTWKAYPEYVELFLRKALQAHNLKESLSLYAQVLAASETVAGVAAVPGSVAGFFTALDTQFAAYRDAFWLPRNQVIDTVLPRWVLNVLRQALARKTVENEVAALQVADATINGLFASINVRVNFVTGTHRLAVSTDGAGNTVSPIVPAAGVNLWPDRVPVLAWVPGSVVHLNDPDWNIGIERLRDTTLQRQNAYSVFTETFSGLAYPCPYPVQSFDVEFCPAGDRSPVGDYVCTDLVAPVTAS